MNAADRIIRHVIVRGRVQGVGFRAFVEDLALAHELDGWVRNRRDGAVEAMFAGTADRVADMIEACRQGPPASRVDRLDACEAGADLLGDKRRGFFVLPTV